MHRSPSPRCLRESIPIPNDRVYCPICHTAKVDITEIADTLSQMRARAVEVWMGLRFGPDKALHSYWTGVTVFSDIEALQPTWQQSGFPMPHPGQKKFQKRPVAIAAAAELRIRVASTWSGMAWRTAAASAASAAGMGSAIISRLRSR